MISASSRIQKGHVRGFTLIELLVVIAIIGILSAVVLASLNTARSKGNDAAIKSNLDTVRTQSAIYYDSNNNNYGTNTATKGVCTDTTTMIGGDPNVQAALVSADKAAGGSGSFTKVVCNTTANGASWMIYTPLSNPSVTTNNGWCVDSTGASKETATKTSASTSC